MSWHEHIERICHDDQKTLGPTEHAPQDPPVPPDGRADPRDVAPRQMSRPRPGRRQGCRAAGPARTTGTNSTTGTNRTTGTTGPARTARATGTNRRHRALRARPHHRHRPPARYGRRGQ
ncbi:hypothetical protein GCM10018781_12600 [Kitasatospora indigofera]|uniref:Uncharacterized protein n=1 Tax=Kitasatospora indigofera TaxID=67307 RepID=A0A919FF02_9ACTN|nr:hypothetical protein GCM10018781_12600 [Kitasatospora indigofera]